MARRRYSPEEIERGLTTLILAGSSPRAAEQTGIPEATLRNWKVDNRDQYDRLCKDLEPKVVDKIASEAENIVIQLADIQREYVQMLHNTKESLKPGEIPGALRNVATAAALNVDKLSSPLRERPSHVQQQTDIDGLINQMARRLGWDATAVPNEAQSEALEMPQNASDPRNGGPLERLNEAS